MRCISACALLLLSASAAAAQPADCATQAAPGPAIPLAIDLAGRAGVPGGLSGQAYVAVPLQPPLTDCGEASPPADVLRGEPGDLLRGHPPVR